MDSTKIKYVLRLKIEADLILPKPSLDRPPKRCIVPRATFLADEYLLKAVFRYVDLIDTISDDVDIMPQPGNTINHQPELVDLVDVRAVDLPLDFYKKWFEKYGTLGVRAGQLLDVIEEISLSLANLPNRHARISRLGELLCQNTEVGNKWTIEVRKSGHSNKFILHSNVNNFKVES